MMTWGPYFWGTLHIACLVAPPVLSEEHKSIYITFIKSYSMVLPCPACRTHFQQILENFPVENHVNTSMELFAWSVTAHNIVNAKIGKPLVSFSEAFQYWSTRSNYDEQFPIENTLLLLGVIISIYFLLVK